MQGITSPTITPFMFGNGCRSMLGAKAKELGKHIIAVQLNSLYEYPEELKNCGAKRVYSFNHDDIVSAIRGW